MFSEIRMSYFSSGMPLDIFLFDTSKAVTVLSIPSFTKKARSFHLFALFLGRVPTILFSFFVNNVQVNQKSGFLLLSKK